MARAAGDSWIEPGQEELTSESYGWKYEALSGLVTVVALQRDRETAGRLLRGISCARGPWVPGFAPTRGEAMGLLASVVGDFDAAATCLSDTLDFYRRAGMKPLQAWACLELAEVLLARDGDGDRQRSAEVLKEGGLIARSLGLKPLHRKIIGVIPHERRPPRRRQPGRH